jgi:glycosyltransferase involved in cell wall biosynthesis
VLHLIWALDLGGAERQVIEIVRGLDRRRFEPLVGCLVRKGRWGTALESEGVPVFDLAKRPGIDPGLPFRLAGLMRRERVDVVHTHAFTAATWGRLAAVLARVPVVVAHEHSAFSLPSAVRRLVDRALAPCTDRWVAVSESLARDLLAGEGLPAARMTVIKNGIPTPLPIDPETVARVRRELEGPERGRLAGTVGRLEERKGLEVFLDALAALRQGRPDVRAALVGEGPLEGALRDRARALGLQDAVSFMGRREDVAAVLEALDVFVLPSHTEGLSIALLEAATAGCAIVATDVGGNPEVVTHGETGLLVPPGDPGALAQALGEVLDDPARAGRLGAAASADARRRFGSAPMVAALETLYDGLLSGRAPAGGGHA